MERFRPWTVPRVLQNPGTDFTLIALFVLLFVVFMNQFFYPRLELRITREPSNIADSFPVGAANTTLGLAS